MHVLHTRPDTGGFAVHAALVQSGIEHRLETVSAEDHQTPEFAAMNPMRQLPVLTLPDGSIMTESAAMLIYLGDLAPDSGLAPTASSPLRPAYLRWMVFCSSNLYMSDLRYYYPDRYTTDPTGIDGVMAAARRDLESQYRILDSALEDKAFLLGDDWSGVDIYATMITYWHPDVSAFLPTCPNLERMTSAAKELPCIVAANDFHKMW